MGYGYDSYRPENEPPGEASRRFPTRDAREDSNFWRREQPQERRGRRDSSDVNTSSDVNQSHGSPDIPTGPRSHSRRARSRSIAAPQSTSTDLPAGETPLASRRSSMSIHPSHVSPNLPGNALRLPTRQALQEIDPTNNKMSAHQATNTQHHSGTTDPRLRAHAHRTVTGQEPVGSPTTQSGNDAHDTKDYACLIRNLTAAVMEHHDAQRRVDDSSRRIESHEEELNTARKMFPLGNLYIEKIQQEILKMRTSQEAQKVLLQKKEERMGSAVQAMTAHEKKNDATANDVQELKSRLKEQQKQSKRWEEVNEGLQKQLVELSQVVEKLRSEMTQELPTLHSKIANQVAQVRTLVKGSALTTESLSPFLLDDRRRLAQYETELKGFRDKDLRSLRSDVKAQELKMTRLNDMFATQKSLQSLEARMERLSKRVSPAPEEVRPSTADFITQTQLDSYVTVFNTFESNMDKRISSLESLQKATSVNLEEIAKKDSSKHQQGLGETKNNAENDRRLGDLETTSRSQTEDIKAYIQITEKLQESVSRSQDSLKSLVNQQSNKLSKFEKEITNVGPALEANAARLNKLAELPQHLSLVTSRLTTLETGHNKLQQLNNINQNVIGQTQNTHTQKIGSLFGLTRGLDETSKANSHAIDSLNQRFDNLSTDRLARQIAGVIEPMLVSITPQVQELSAQLPQLRSIQETFQALQNSLADKVSATNSLISDLQDTVNRIDSSHSEAGTRLSSIEDGAKAITQQLSDLDKLEKSVQAVQDDIISIRDRTHKAINQSAIEVKANIETLEGSMDTRIAEGLARVSESTTVAINGVKEEQSASLVSLLDEVREARNGIDARLADIEAEMKSRRDETVIPTTSKQNLSQKKVLRGTSGTTPVQSPASKSTASITSSNSEAKIVLTKNGHLHKDSASKAGVPSSRSSKISPLAKHFPPQSDDDMDDTIIITSNGQSEAAGHRDRSDIISISGSDSNNEDNEARNDERNVELNGEHYIKPQQPMVTIRGWKKPSTHDDPLLEEANTNTANMSIGRGDDRLLAIVDSPAKPKRKRERSQATSKGGRHGTNSNQSTPSSSQGKKKKKKV